MSPRNSFALMVLVVAFVASVGYLAVKYSEAASCAVSADLVNSCHPLLATYAQGYNLGSGFANTGPSVAQTEAAEKRAGRNFDVIHTSYHEGDGGDTLTPEEISFAKTNQTIFVNWWPTKNWAQGDTSAIYGEVDAMAASIKKNVPSGTKIFMVDQHEQNDKVSKLDSPNDSTCPANVSLPGSSGTPAQYRAMYINVENRFKADGVTNIEWAMLFESFNQDNDNAFPNCLDQALYPGNAYVQWVGFDTYGNGAPYTGTTGSGAFQETAGKTYQFFEKLSGEANTSTYGMLANNRPIVIGEFNSCRSSYSSQQNADYWKDAKYALDKHLYPAIQLYMAFDAPGTGNSAPGGCQLGYTGSGQPVAGNIVQNAFNAFANDSIFDASKETATPTPSPSPTPKPTPTPTHTPTPSPTPKPTPTPSPTPTPTPTSTATPTPTATPCSGMAACKVPTPAPPTHVRASLVLSDLVVLTWDAPADTSNVKGYHVYRNGTYIGNATLPYYIDTTVSAGTSYTYGIDSHDAQSDVSARVDVKVLTPSKLSVPPPISVPPIMIAPASVAPVSVPPDITPTVGGTVALAPVTSNAPVAGTTTAVAVDGGATSSTGQIDTTYLTNGTHQMVVTSTTPSGQTQTASRSITVANQLTPFQSTRDELFAAFHGNVADVNTGVGIVVALIFLGLCGFSVWLWRSTSKPKSPTKARATLR